MQADLKFIGRQRWQKPILQVISVYRELLQVARQFSEDFGTFNS